MPVAWSIARCLFKLVAPSVPDVVSSITTFKKQQAEPQSREEPFHARIAEMEHKFTQQLELMEKLTKQVDSLQTILRRTLIISIVAFFLSLTGLTLLLYGT